MSFLTPSALLWFALALPIVFFYILKIRLRRVPVSTTMFWEQIFEQKQPRSIWEYLRHLLSLLVQLAMLALLVLALAEPSFRWQSQGGRRTVLIVDNSASMGGTDVAPNRLDAAKQRGVQLINAMRFTDEMAIIAAGAEPQVYSGMTDHQRTLRNALDAVPQTDGPTRVGQAVELARRLLADRKDRKIVILTDAAFDGATKLAGEPNIELSSVGKPTDNVGITQFQVRRSLRDPIGYEILVEVRNASEKAVDTRLEVDLNDDVIDVVPLTLEPGKPWRQTFEKTSADGGRITASLDRDDALMADNHAWAILPRREVQPVSLVTEANLFLQKVFEAIPLVRLTVLKDPNSAQLSPNGVRVFHKSVPAKVPPGPVLVIQPDRSTDLWQLGEPIDTPFVATRDKDSPLMAHVKLENVNMPEARHLTIPGKHHVLASSLDGNPLYVQIDRPEGPILLITVDLDRSELPLLTAFPILMTNAMAWFAGPKGELRESVATGDVTEVELPARSSGSGPLVLRSPDGSSRPLPTSSGKVVIGPLDRCGVWSVAEAGTKKSTEGSPRAAQVDVEIACNLSNPRESDLRPSPGLPAPDRSISGRFGGRPPWYYLIALAWGLAGLEWFLYQRRWIS